MTHTQMHKQSRRQNSESHSIRTAKDKNESSLKDFQDNIRYTNTCIIGIPKEKRKGYKYI